jgi:hypothetical protein
VSNLFIQSCVFINCRDIPVNTMLKVEGVPADVGTRDLKVKLFLCVCSLSGFAPKSVKSFDLFVVIIVV